MAAPDIPSDLIESLKKAKHVVAMTGAGISAESGVPTFRDAQTGLWAKYEPTELATPMAFERDPKLVWDWYSWRRDLVKDVLPNPGHIAIVELSKRFPKFTLITQNIDGLHQLAGSSNAIELHGSILRTKCFENSHPLDGWPDDAHEQPPKCEQCGSLMRPAVVWFHESLPSDAIESAAAATNECDVFFSIGTSSVVHPAASLAFNAAENGATVVEVNPNETPLTPKVTYSLCGPSGEILPELVKRLVG